MNVVTAEEIRQEVRRARAKFPDTTCLFSALCEEVGELSRALGGDGNVAAEAIQVAAMAVRILEEGDASSVQAQDVVHDIARTLEMAARTTMKRAEETKSASF